MTISIYYSSLTRSWCATVYGPWYDDSNPDGDGKTKQEALDNAWISLLEVQKEINEFIAKGKPTLEQINHE
jgi:hypothetical protein